MKKSSVMLFFAVILLVCSLSHGSSASEIRDAITFLNTDESLDYRFQVHFTKLSQYDETRTQQLNDLLKHFHFSGYIDKGESSLSIQIDDKEMFTITEMIHGESVIRTFSRDSENLFVLPSGSRFPSNGMQIPDLSGYNLLRNVALYASLDPYIAFFQQLPSIFPEHSSSVTILEKYRDYGAAVRKVSIVLTGDDLNEYFSGHISEYRQLPFYPNPCDCIFEGRQSFALLFTEEGNLLKISYSGRAGFSEDDFRNVRIDWKTVRTDTFGKDEFELRTPDSEGTRRDNLLLTSAWLKSEDGTETFTWSAETDHVSDGIRTRIFDNAELQAAEHRITGRVSENITTKGSDTGTEAIVNVTVPADCTSSGTLEIITKKDKIETDHIIFDFELSSANAAPVSAIQPRIQTLSEDEYKALLNDLVFEILSEILRFPDDDLIFLKNGIPDDQWDQILNLND